MTSVQRVVCQPTGLKTKSQLVVSASVLIRMGRFAPKRSARHTVHPVDRIHHHAVFRRCFVKGDDIRIHHDDLALKALPDGAEVDACEEEVPEGGQHGGGDDEADRRKELPTNSLRLIR